MIEDLPVNERVTLPADAMWWSASHASGPGGQNVNKVATRVELVLDTAACGLSDVVLARLRPLAGRRWDRGGLLHIISSRTRSQQRNLADARERLALLVAQALVEPVQRKPTRPTAGSRRRRLEGKRQRSEVKRLRGKPAGGGE